MRNFTNRNVGNSPPLSPRVRLWPSLAVNENGGVRPLEREEKEPTYVHTSPTYKRRGETTFPPRRADPPPLARSGGQKRRRGGRRPTQRLLSDTTGEEEEEEGEEEEEEGDGINRSAGVPSFVVCGL